MSSEEPVYNIWPPELWAIITSSYHNTTKQIIRRFRDMPYESRLVQARKVFNLEPEAGEDKKYFRLLAMAYALPDSALENLVKSFDLSFDEAVDIIGEYMDEPRESISQYLRKVLEEASKLNN